MAKAGYYKGRHYTEWVEEVRYLKRKGRLAEAEELLLGLISATESERRKEGPRWGLPPAYTKDLAIVYRKQRRYQDEIDILTRYMQVDEGHFEMFSDRRRKAELLLEKAGVVGQFADVKSRETVSVDSRDGCASVLLLVVGLTAIVAAVFI